MFLVCGAIGDTSAPAHEFDAILTRLLIALTSRTSNARPCTGKPFRVMRIVCEAQEVLQVQLTIYLSSLWGFFFSLQRWLVKINPMLKSTTNWAFNVEKCHRHLFYTDVLLTDRKVSIETKLAHSESIHRISSKKVILVCLDSWLIPSSILNHFVFKIT